MTDASRTDPRVKDDSKIIETVLSGDSAAFGELVLKYQNRLYASMLHVTGSSDDAEDVVQDAFVRAFVKLHTFQQHSQFFTWLYRIAFNSALSNRRRHRSTVSIDYSRESGGVDPTDPIEAPDANLLRDERIVRVRKALEQLTEDHRAILILREMEDLAYEDIAHILEITIGTVRSRLSRARAALKIVLEEMDA